MREPGAPSIVRGYSALTQKSPCGRRTWPREVWRRSGTAVFTTRPICVPTAVAVVPVICDMASETADREASSSSVPAWPIMRPAMVAAASAGTT